MKTSPYKIKMWAVMRDGEPYMVLPDIETAEARYGSLSLNGFSKHKWELKPAEVRFPHETAIERRTRLNRHIQTLVDLNRAIRARR